MVQMQIICLFHLTKFSAEFFLCLIQYLFQTDKHHCFSSRQNIFYVYSFKHEWNRIGLLSKWNDPDGTGLWNNENAFHVIHLFFFFWFFSMFSSTFAHDLFTKCSCVVVFPTQINYIVVNSSFLSYRNITSRCTMLVLDNAISYTN